VKWKGNIADKNPKKAETAVRSTLEGAEEARPEFGRRLQRGRPIPVGLVARRGRAPGRRVVLLRPEAHRAPIPKEIERLDAKNPKQGYLGRTKSTIEAWSSPD